VLFPGIIADGMRAQGFVEDLWVDVGSPERYLRATRLLLERETARHGRALLDDGAQIAAGVEFIGNVLVGDGASIAVRARVAGASSIGARAVVGEDAVVERSVLWDNARIGAGATVRDSIIAAGASVGAGAVVEEAILADGARVPDGVRLDRGARLMPGEAAGDVPETR
jgi:mannose-1-phosphate guanylyltransferase